VSSFFRNKDNFFLLFILLLASLLRLYKLADIPFTHDEFSALFRTEFDNFSALIKGGVLPDTHPAGVQVFMFYWIRILGSEEWIVKLPFIIMGISSVYLIWLIAKNWFNPSVAILASLFLAGLEFPIMHSQIARPYISGLFLSLWMVYHWSQYLFATRSKINKHLILYVLASALCAYNHHFTLLFAAMVGISGLFFIDKRRILSFALSGLAIFLLYVPHLSIFFHQLNKGGVGGDDGWLGAPQSDFLWQFIYYIFDFSKLLLLVVVLLILLGFRQKNPDYKTKRKFIYLSIAWFLIPFLIGYFYSVKVNPVLQYSVLLFTFPFLFFILFGHINDLSNKWKLGIIIVITPILVYTLIYDRQYYHLFYNSPYQGIVENSISFQQRNEENDGVSIIDSDIQISEYFIDKEDPNLDYIFADEFASTRDFISFLQDNEQSTLSLGAITSSDPKLPFIIYDYLPHLSKRIDYNQANYYEFSKNETINIPLYREKAFLNSFDILSDYWSFSMKTVIQDSIGNRVFAFQEEQEWGLLFEIKLDELIEHENDVIDIQLDLKSADQKDELLIVSEILDEKNKYDWRSSSSRDFFETDGKEYRMYHSIKLSDIPYPKKTALLKIYCWNKGKTPITIDDFNIKVRIGNPVLYGLLRKIQQK
jgi:hypothetical protein